jgi:Protein of unknown function (DUF3565)
MQQKIIGFHQDELHDWVAQLACGHNQHVRHNPPWTNRPWVITLEGRAAVLARSDNNTLVCRKCESGAPRDRL